MVTPPVTMATMVVFMVATPMGVVVVAVVCHECVCDGHCYLVDAQGCPCRALCGYTIKVHCV